MKSEKQEDEGASEGMDATQLQFCVAAVDHQLRGASVTHDARQLQFCAAAVDGWLGGQREHEALAVVARMGNGVC